jgi:hypothetical protein
MDRRRLVDAPGDRFEVVNGYCVWIHVSVPTHHVKRMIPINVSVKISMLLDAHFELTLLISGLELGRGSDIALTIRAVFEELA